IFILSIFFSFNIQGKNKIDSLLIELNQTKNNYKKINIYNQLSDIIVVSDLKKAMLYANQALQLAYKIKYITGFAKACSNIGTCYSFLGNNLESLKYYNIALLIYNTIGFDDGIASCHLNIGNIYYYMGNYIKAIEHYQKSIEGYYKIDNKRGIAGCLANIGIIYVCQKNYDKALEYYYKSLATNIQSNDKIYLATLYSNIGSSYLDLGQIDKALYYQYNALKISKENDFKLGIAHSYLNIGNIYEEKKKYDKALYFYKKSYDIIKESDNKIWSLDCLNEISKLYITLEKYDAALFYAKQAYTISNKIICNDQLTKTLLNLSIIYEKKANFYNALKFHKLYVNINDSFFSETHQKKLIELTQKYEAEKIEKDLIEKNAKIYLLEKNKKIAVYKQKGLITLILIGIIIIIILQKRIKMNKKIYEYKIKNDENQLLLSKLELNNQKLQIEQLQQNIYFQETKLKYKEQELINLALHIHEKNNFLKKLEKTLTKTNFNPKEIIKLIDTNLYNLEKNKKEFDAYVDSVSHDFFINIRKLLPDINKSEERLLILLRLGLPSKEIADILNISTRSVEIARYRLRKKLNLNRKESLSNFLKKI
ncbi:MAG TPA: tetratricopeptide repeat protein, partial [Bacteroidales bacterium]|nr:tetratricopeptide repeat protein [Bacteroidales bacterium]